MKFYILKRILSLIPVLLIVSTVLFLINYLTPGDPASVLLGDNATPEQINQLRSEMGLNRPVHQQYFGYLANLLQGDLGYSYFFDVSVKDTLFNHISPTFILAFTAQILAIIIALPLGIMASKNRGTRKDTTIMGFSLLGISVPSFLLGLFLIIIFAVKLKWLPVSGYQPLSSGIINHLKYIILPSVSLAVMQAALITRMTRSSMLDVLNMDYIKTAKAKGAKERKIIYVHAFKNASLPILTIVGQTFGTLIMGSVVIETVFNIPGIGQLIINSVERRDYEIVQGVVLFITTGYVVVNLIVDLLYGVIDPRIKLDEK